MTGNEEMRKRAESSDAGGQPFSGQGNAASLMSEYYAQIWSKVRQTELPPAYWLPPAGRTTVSDT